MSNRLFPRVTTLVVLAATAFYFWPTPGTFVLLGSSVQGLLTGQKSVDQVLTDLDNSWGK